MTQRPTREALEQRIRELESAVSEFRGTAGKPQGEAIGRSLFNNMLHEVHVWELIFDDSGNIRTWKLVDANPAALKSWDQNLSDIVGKTADEIFPKSKATELFMPVVSKIFAEGKPHKWEMYFPDTDQHLYMNSFPLGKCFISTGVDISDIKRAESALVASEKKWRNILASMPQLGVSLDRHARIIFANNHFLELTGWRPAEVLGQDWFECFIPEEMIKEVRQTFLSMIEDRETSSFSSFDNAVLTRTGQRINVAWSSVVSRDHHGDVVDITSLGVDLTERKSNEILLEKKNTDLMLAQRIASIGTWTLDPEVGVPEWSEEIYRIYERHPGLGPYPLDAYKQVYRGKWFERFHGAIQGAIAEGIPYDIELKLRLPSGTVRWIHAICEPESEAGPKGHKLRGTIQDISMQKQSQFHLQKTKDRLESLWSIARIADADIGTLCDHVIEEVKKITESEYAFYGFLSDDERSMALHAWSRDAMADCRIADQPRHFSIDDAGVWADAVRKKQIVTINDFHGNRAIRKGVPEGHVPLNRMMAVPLEINDKIVSIATVANKKTNYTKEDEKQVLAFLNNVQILIDRKNNEEMLLVQQKAISLNNRIATVFLSSSENDIFADTLDILLETLESPYGYFGFIDETGNLNCPSMTREIWDQCNIPGKRIVFPRQVWGGLWGDSLEESRTIIANSGLTLPEGHIRIDSAMAVPIVHHGMLIGQFVVAGRNGGYGQNEKTLLESAAAQTAPILNSLLEKNAQEKVHEKMQQRIEQAQKMESVGNLAGGIAHDFNNILFPIIGLSELIMEDVESDSEIYQNAQEIYNAGTRAKDLVAQILSFSRRTDHEMTPVRFQNVLKEVLKLCRATIPMNIDIKHRIQQDCWPIWANATQLHQIGMNLITNAFHAVQDKNGEIIVTLKAIIIDETDLSRHSLRPGNYVMLTVSDNGRGMPEETLRKIFEPYFTTKEKGKGTGLGLSVVYGIVKELGGDLRVSSEIGSGSTFSVYLPVINEFADSDLDEADTDMQTGDEHILLVDDEPPIARFLQLALQRLGYEVTICTSSFEALDLFREDSSRFDMIISDMSMPKMAGDELSYEIRCIRPEMPVVICTGFSRRINKKKAEKIGVNGFLMKPVAKTELARMIRSVLDGSE